MKRLKDWFVKRFPMFIEPGTCATIISYMPRKFCHYPAATHWRFVNNICTMTCKNHIVEDGHPFRVAQSHETTANCGMPGTHWDIEENACVADDDFLAHVNVEFEIKETVSI